MRDPEPCRRFVKNSQQRSLPPVWRSAGRRERPGEHETLRLPTLVIAQHGDGGRYGKSDQAAGGCGVATGDVFSTTLPTWSVTPSTTSFA